MVGTEKYAQKSTDHCCPPPPQNDEDFRAPREKQIKSRQRRNTTRRTVLEGNFYVSQYVGAYKKAQNYHYNPPQKKSSQICQICQQKNQPNAGTPLIQRHSSPLHSPLQNLRCDSPIFVYIHRAKMVGGWISSVEITRFLFTTTDGF